MAAPNSYDFTVTRDNLITDALLHISAIGEGETPSSAAVTEAARLLNMMIKLRAAEGMPLWAIRRGIILPTTEVSKIATNSHIVTTYQRTEIATAAASTDTSFTVDSTTGMAVGDYVGIECDDDTMHWTTVATVPSSTTFTVDDAIDDESAVDSAVFWYTAADDRVIRPIRILHANILKPDDGSSWEINIEERNDYFSLGNRTNSGIPNRIFYDPILGTRAADPATSSTWYGEVYVYPRFDGGQYVIEFTYQEPMQDLDAASDNPYFPQEFYLPLMLELSALLGPKHGLPIDERKALFAEAKMYREEALETVYEEGSMFIQPEDQNAR